MNKSDSHYHYKYHKYKTKYEKLNINIDTKKIIGIAQQVQILGMAEATHGQNLITKFRINLFKKLVKKCGYTVFVLEDDYSCCEQINKYIKTGTGNLYDLLMQLSWYWASKAIENLIKWMRQYNQDHNNILEFKGIDIQKICHNYNDKNDLVAKYVKKLNKQNDKINQDDWVEADGFRDRSMFNVFMNFYDRNKKYFLYAHNYHIAKKDLIGSDKSNRKFEGRDILKGDHVDWLGYKLANKFGTDYYAIGNIFNSGSYLETYDLIEQRRESGFGTKYKKYKNSDIYIVVYDIPRVGNINTDKLPIGLNTMRPNSEFDAILNLGSEIPLEIISLDSPY
jgi:erythromycin esterase